MLSAWLARLSGLTKRSWEIEDPVKNLPSNICPRPGLLTFLLNNWTKYDGKLNRNKKLNSESGELVQSIAFKMLANTSSTEPAKSLFHMMLCRREKVTSVLARYRQKSFNIAMQVLSILKHHTLIAPKWIYETRYFRKSIFAQRRWEWIPMPFLLELKFALGMKFIFGV